MHMLPTNTRRALTWVALAALAAAPALVWALGLYVGGTAAFSAAVVLATNSR